jgi:outer membrane protein assembly factor BamB/tetratricopeptide (TPR) repeat protein
MRKCFTGRVGDASFKKALAFLEEGGRATLFVNDGVREKAIHFSQERIWKLPWNPQGEEAARVPPGLRSPPEVRPATGTQPSEKPAAPGGAAYLEEARAFVRSEIEEVLSWQGALFEVREGPTPVRSPLWSKALEIHASPAGILVGISKLAAPPKPTSPSRAFPDDALPRADVLANLVSRPANAATVHVLLRELAAAWKEVGSLHRAARCLLCLARHYLEWSDEEKARAMLESALELCPVDAAAAEQLISLHVSAGRHREAEAVAETICRQFQSWKLHDLLARFYKLLGRAPESAVLRRVGAEAMIRTGDVTHGLKEMSAVAAILDSKGDKQGARSAFERVFELDPANASARKKVQGARRRDLWIVYLVRWGSLAAAIVLAGAWVLWDVAAASALERVKGGASDPRAELELLRTEAAHYPTTRQPARLASREEQVYDRSLEDDWKLIREALDARAAGDVGTAHHLFGTVAKRTLIPAFAARAEAERAEIQKSEAEREARLRHAAKLVQGRDFEGACKVYIGLLKGERRAIHASSYSVPVLVDSAPHGAEIEIDRRQEGRTPRWVFLSSDPESTLRLSLRGFRTLEITDPLAAVLDSGAAQIRRPLVPETGWQTGSWGGTVAAGANPDALMIPVLGADGVLRGIAPRARKPAWETPLDGSFARRGAPVAVGPVIAAAASRGSVAGISVSSGKVAWTLSLGERGSETLLGPVFSGQLAVVRGSEVIFVNPQSGLVQRRIDAGFEVQPDGLAVLGDRAFAADGKGGVARIALRTGKTERQTKDLARGRTMLFACGEGIVAVSRSGEVTGLSPALDGRAWEARVGNEVGAAWASRGRVFLAVSGGSLVCLDAAAGTPLWKTALAGEVKGLAGSESAADTIAVTVTRGGRACVTAIGAADGSVLWEVEAGRAEEPSVALDELSAAVSSPSLGVVVLPTSTR